jgi:small multidrug resistance family-3 protein
VALPLVHAVDNSMKFISTFGLFCFTAIAEIVGCYCIYAWLRLEKSPWLILPSALSLALFAWLLTIHPSHAGRVYAAYGGVYVFMSIIWLWAFEKQTPDVWDLTGCGLALLGMGIIAFAPHKI